MASFAVSFQSPVLVDRSGFMAGLTSVSFQSWRARCSTMWISGSILTWYARHKVLGVCLMSWSICNHECKDPLFGSSVTALFKTFLETLVPLMTNRLQLVKCSINDSNLVPKSKTRKRTQQDSCVSRSATTLLYIYSSYWATTTTPLPQPLHLCIKLTSFSLSSCPTGPTSFVWIDPACAPGRRPHDFD